MPNLKIHSIRSLCTFAVLLSCLSSRAESLWEFIDENWYEQTLSTLTVPADSDYQQAVRIEESVLAGLGEKGLLEAKLDSTLAYEFEVQQRYDYQNGNQGWLAAMALQGEYYATTLTRSADLLLVSIHSPSGHFAIKAQAAQEERGYLVGWIYSAPQNFERVSFENEAIPELGFAYAGSTASSALSRSGVAVYQDFPLNNVVVGEEFQVSFIVRNNTETLLRGESLKVTDLLKNTLYVRGPANCKVVNPDVAPAKSAELQCALQDVSPGASAEVSVTLLALEQAYPSLTSQMSLAGVYDTKYLSVSHNTLLDSDLDGISDFNERLLSTNPQDALSGVSPDDTAEIDLLFVYTEKFLNDLDHGDPGLAIDSIVLQTNAMYLASGAAVTFKSVGYERVDYEVNNNIRTALNDLRNNNGALSRVDFLRQTRGADLVVLLDGIYFDDNACGVAYGGGSNSQGDFSHQTNLGFAYTALYMPGGYDRVKHIGCGNDLLAHELGHLLGLGHSRFGSADASTFAWARGHGVNSMFHTIMAYADHFPSSAGLPRFSNPQLHDCMLQACGVSRLDSEQGADSVLAINTTRYQVANYIQKRPRLSVSTLSGKPTQAAMWGGAIRTDSQSYSRNFSTRFTPWDSVSLTGGINVDPAHIGRTGTLHVVVQQENGGYLQLDRSGSFVPWNGDIATLLGTRSVAAFAPSEELVVLENIVFADVDIHQGKFTVHFAYSVNSSVNTSVNSSGNGDDSFVYSEEGVPFTIAMN